MWWQREIKSESNRLEVNKGWGLEIGEMESEGLRSEMEGEGLRDGGWSSEGEGLRDGR